LLPYSKKDALIRINLPKGRGTATGRHLCRARWKRFQVVDLDQSSWLPGLPNKLFGLGPEVLIDRTILAAAKLPTISLRFSPGETVYERGAQAQFVYVVEGALCRFKLLPDGRRRISQFLFPGDGFGFENGKQRDDTVAALTEAEVICLGKDMLLEAAKSDARLSNLLFTAAVRAAVVATEHSNALWGRTATEQLALFLLEMDARLSKRGEIDLPMRRQHIADYLGLSMETVSRTFTAFHKARIIDFLDNPKLQRRVLIRDKRRLERFASDAADFGWGKS
jgi:CRP/FNR family nitrogen fixation transcriptional regulator